MQIKKPSLRGGQFLSLNLVADEAISFLVMRLLRFARKDNLFYLFLWITFFTAAMIAFESIPHLAISSLGSPLSPK